MAQSSWPDPAAGRVVDDRQYEMLSARHSDDGLYGVYTDPNPVFGTGEGLTVTVRANLYGSVRGHGWTSGPENVVLNIDTNSSGQTRLDRVVLRLDRSTWTVRAAIRKGSPGAGLPALVRDPGPTGVWEIHLAQVTITSGSTSIQAGNVAARPLYVGARIRHQMSSARNPNPIPGEIHYDFDTGRWVGWTGAAWVVLYPVTSDSGDVSLPLATGFVATAQTDANKVRKINGQVSIDLNAKWQPANASEYIAENNPGRRVATVPVGFRPSTRKVSSVILSGDNACQLHVQPDGAIEVWHLFKDVEYQTIFRDNITYIP